MRTTDGKATDLVNAFRAFDKCHVSGIEVECPPYTDLGIRVWQRERYGNKLKEFAIALQAAVE